MEVAQLTAQLQAEIGGFLRNMELADLSTASVRKTLGDLERAAAEATVVLNQVKMDTRQGAETRTVLDTMKGSLSGVTATAMEAADHLHDVKMRESEAVETRVVADQISDSLDKVTRKALEARAALGGASRGGRGGVGNGRGGDNLLEGILPGGRRGGPLAYAFLGTLGIAAAPELLAGAGGLGLGAVDMAGMFGGSIGAVKLSGISDVIKGMSDYKVYQGLDSTQKSLANLLRTVDGGLGERVLEPIAQKGLFPGLQRGITSALTPNTVGMLAQTTQGFSGALGGAAMDWGKYLGSSGFSTQFGEMMKRDSGYVGDFSKNLQGLFDATIRMTNAGSGFTNWLDQVSTHGVRAIDMWAKSAKGQQDLARFSVLAEHGLIDTTHAVMGLVNVLNALFHVTSSLNMLNLLAEILNTIAGIINQNRDAFSHLFEGARGSIEDLLSVIRMLEPLLHTLLTDIDAIAGHIGGWRTLIDAAAVVWVARWASMRFAGVSAATETEAALAPLLAELEAINAQLAATAGVGVEAAAGITAVGGAAAAAEAEVGALAATATAALGLLGKLSKGGAYTFGGFDQGQMGYREYNQGGRHYVQYHNPSGWTSPHDVGPAKAGVVAGSALSKGAKYKPSLHPGAGATGGDGLYGFNTNYSVDPGDRAGSPLPPVFTGQFTDQQRQEIAKAQYAIAMAATPSAQAAAQNQLRGVYAGILAEVQRAHPANASGLTAQTEEEAQLAQAMQTYGPKPAFSKNVPKPKKKAFDPLTVSEHASITQAVQALASAQQSGDIPSEVQAAQALMLVYQTTLKSVTAEHELGKDRVRQLAEEATLTKDIASTHAEIVRLQKQEVKVLDLFKGPYLTSPNAQIAYQFGYKPSAVDLTRDLQSQVKESKQWMADLKLLATRGAGQNLLSTLQAAGVGDAHNVHVLAHAPAALLHQYENLFRKRLQQTKTQNVAIVAENVTVTDRSGRPIASRNTSGAGKSGDAFLASRKQKFIATRRNY